MIKASYVGPEQAVEVHSCHRHYCTFNTHALAAEVCCTDNSLTLLY
jgi:hypothetical protein